MFLVSVIPSGMQFCGCPVLLYIPSITIALYWVHFLLAWFSYRCQQVVVLFSCEFCYGVFWRLLVCVIQDLSVFEQVTFLCEDMYMTTDRCVWVLFA